MPMAATSGGDLQQLYQEHFVSLTRLAAMVVRDRETAEDVVQDCFVAVHRKWPKFARWDEPRVLGYVRAAVLNGARSQVRRRIVAQQHPEPVSGVMAAAENTALARPADSEISALLAQLPQRQQEVLLLRYLLDLSVADTAATLRISPSAVTTSTARGLAALRAVLSPGDDQQ